MLVKNSQIASNQADIIATLSTHELIILRWAAAYFFHGSDQKNFFFQN